MKIHNTIRWCACISSRMISHLISILSRLTASPTLSLLLCLCYTTPHVMCISYISRLLGMKWNRIVHAEQQKDRRCNFSNFPIYFEIKNENMKSKKTFDSNRSGFGRPWCGAVKELPFCFIRHNWRRRRAHTHTHKHRIHVIEKI